MPDELVPKPEEPVKFDQISGSLESQQPVVHFSQQNNFSLNELPPLNQLDDCSEETRKFAMECYSKEGDFRHKLIEQSEKSSSELAILRETNAHKQKQSGAIAGTGITLASLGWSCYMVSIGETLVGMAPFIVAVAGLVLAGAWGKRQKADSIESEDSSEAADE